MAQQYGNVDYWDDRYSNDKEPFEWYQNYGGIRNFLTPKYLSKTPGDKAVLEDSDKPSEKSGHVADEAAENPIQADEKDGSEQKVHSDGTETPTKIPSKPIETPSEEIKYTKNPFLSTKDCRVLIAGCGNSQVGEAMLGDSFRKITNVDYSSIVVNQMKEKYTEEWHEKLYTRLHRERKLEGKEEQATMKSPGKKDPKVRARPSPARGRASKPVLSKKKGHQSGVEKMVFDCQDLTKKLKFPDESFHLIFCKGTLDAVLCSANTADKVQTMMNECHRVLDNQHGVMVIVSFGEPENRLNIFDNARWEVKTYTVRKPIVPGEEIGDDHYVYILFKKEI